MTKRISAALALPEAADLAVIERQLNEDAADLMDGAQGATRAAYGKQWRYFARWSVPLRKDIGPPTDAMVVAQYLGWLVKHSGRSLSYVQQAAAAIAYEHARRGLSAPTRHPQIRLMLQAARKRLGVAPARQATPLLPGIVRERLLPLLPRDASGGLTPRGLRDRVILTFGVAVALRRVELCGLLLARLEKVPNGYVVHVDRSKNDPDGEGRKNLVAYGDHEQSCPVRALEYWIAFSRVNDGAVLRGVSRHGMALDKPLQPESLCWIIADYAKRAGLRGHYSGHSLRRGYATAARRSGKSELEIQRHMGHKDPKSTRRYIEDVDVESSTASAGIGF